MNICLLIFLSAVSFSEDIVKPIYLQEFEKLKSKSNEVFKNLEQKYASKFELAQTEVEQKKIGDEFKIEQNKICEPVYQEAFGLVKNHVSEKEAVNCLIWMHRTNNQKLQEDVRNALIKYHLIHPSTIEMVKEKRLQVDHWIEPFLRAQLAEKNLPEDVRPKVLLALAIHMHAKATAKSSLKFLKNEIERVYTKADMGHLSSLDLEKTEADAIKMYEEVVSKYHNIKTKSGILFGKIAENSIYEIRHLSIGKKLPCLVGEDQDGNKLSTDDFKGKVICISFWASWCGPCMAEFPKKREIVEKYDSKPFVLIGVNVDVDKEVVKKTVSKNKNTWRSIWCGPLGQNGPIPMKWNVSSLPMNYLVDHNGIIQAKMFTFEVIEKQVDQFIQEAEKSK